MVLGSGPLCMPLAAASSLRGRGRAQGAVKRAAGRRHGALADARWPLLGAAGQLAHPTNYQASP
jgi:hypothetical protein